MTDTKESTTTKVNNIDDLTVIEEKVTKVGSDPTIRKYTKGRLLGKGGFAKCFEVVNQENKKVLAAKIISKTTLTKSRAKQKLISEIKIHKSLRHQNVVNFEHVFEDSDNVYILLELCPNQSLHDLIKRRKRLTEIEVQCYTLQIISGLKYLQSRRVIHRDLKLGNLFLNDKMELKMGDFGLAAKLEYDGEKRRTVCGTPNYIAPEIIEGKAGHSYEVDTWSLGVIIYTLIVGRPPFETSDVKMTYKRIKACNYSFPDHLYISDNAKNIVNKMLNLDPSKRPTVDELLQHPFLKDSARIPQFLPVSTLTTAPTTSYLSQFSPQDNVAKTPTPFAQEKMAETTPLGIPKSGRFSNGGQRNNFLNTEKAVSSTPHSPVVVAAVTTAPNENLNVGAAQDNKPSKSDKGANLMAKTGTLSTFSTAQSLKELSRPVTSQKDGIGSIRSTERLKTGNPSSLGSTLRVSGAMSGTLSGAFSGFSRGKGSTSGNEVFVRKWVDYSSKYGMGYVLSNGASGVFFNDNTKLITDPNGEKFEYIYRNYTEKMDTVTSHTFNDYPKDLQKKVTLLHHFKNYLDTNDKCSTTVDNDHEVHNYTGVFVRKWLKTKCATLFRLNTKVVQVNFTDKTEIILNSGSKLVTYVNKKGERSNYPLTTAMENGNSEMAKRLKYTKELLTTMMTGAQQGNIPSLNL